MVPSVMRGRTAASFSRSLLNEFGNLIVCVADVHSKGIMLTLSVRGVSIVGLSLLTTACQPLSFTAGPPPPELQAFVAQPSHQVTTVRAAEASGRWRASGCAHAQEPAPSQITYAAGPMEFDVFGRATRGLWLERVALAGCGQDMVLNVAWVAGNGRISSGPMAPGTTRADPQLQADATKLATVLAQAKVPPCAGAPSFIYDTISSRSVSGQALGAWTERWVISSCGKQVAVPISFTPDGKGGTFLAAAGDGVVVN